MKGLMELPINTIILIVALMGTFMLIVLVYSGLGTTARIVQGNINRLNGIDATHMIESCLMDGRDLIIQDFLEENKGKNVCDLCGICEITAEFKVEDIETKKEWNFNYNYLHQGWTWFTDKVTFWEDSSHVENRILVTLEAEDGEIHMGRLYVWS